MLPQQPAAQQYHQLNGNQQTPQRPVIQQVPQQLPQQVLPHQVSGILQSNLLPAEIEIFDKTQLEVIEFKLSGRRYEDIRNEFSFRSDQQIARYLLRTLLGNRKTDKADGRLPILGDVPTRLFIKEATERADFHNCIKSNQAARILEEILSDYLMHSYMLAQAMNCYSLASEIISRLQNIDFSSS